MDRVVCQVDVFVREIVNTVFLGTRSKIAISIEISFLIAIYRCKQSVASNIKLPAINQQRFLNVFLYYHSAAFARELTSKYRLYLVEVIGHLNATAPVRVLSRLDNPNILTCLFQFGFVEST